MKRSFLTAGVLLALTAPLAVPGRTIADGLLFREDGNFTQLIASAEYYEKANHSANASHYYGLAAKKAATDTERAQAYLGMGKNTNVRYGKPDPATDGMAKLGHYQKVLDLAAAPPKARIEAYFGKAETHAVIAQYDAALASLKLLEAMPEATPEQKRKVWQWNGQILTEALRYDEARVQLGVLVSAADATLAEQLAAHQSITRSYLRQVNLPAALAQNQKINALPGFNDTQRADNFLSNAAILTQFGRHQEARTQMERVAILADAPNDRSLLARLSIGQSFYAEKNYAKAREVWTLALDMRGGAVHAKELWPAIGTGFLEEKNYPNAREAFDKWLAVPGIDLQSRVQAWQYIAKSYVLAKDYPAAHAAIANIDRGYLPTTFEGSALYLRKQLDIAEIFLAEANTAGAQGAYLAILEHIKLSTVAVMGVKPPAYYETPREIKAVADTFAKDKATLTNAFVLYEALEKFYPYELQKAEAFLGMGDVLLAQGKPAEARAMYEKALVLRKNYNEGKIAREKIAALDAPKTAAP